MFGFAAKTASSACTRGDCFKRRAEMDVFERMPHLMVGVSPSDHKLIRLANVAMQMRRRMPAPMVKVLYLAAYVDPPSREDIQEVYAMLWEKPEFRLVQKEVILLTLPVCVREHVVTMLRGHGYTGRDNTILFDQPLHLFH
jgi:hypothetical protein